jgi:hypothetical protein
MTKPGFLKKLGRLFHGSQESAAEKAEPQKNAGPEPETAAAPAASASATPQRSVVRDQTSTTAQQPPRASSQQAATVYQAPTQPLPPTTVPKRTDPASMTAEPAPHLSIEEIAYNSGPEVKVVARGGAMNYAVCPKCEAMWNIKDRLSVILQKRLDKSLTCAACEEMVSLPKSLNLRKLGS